MYEQFWNLKQRPFENDTDPDFFFASQTHQACLLKLRYAVENRQGAALLAGGFGYGKTYLATMLARELPEGFGPFIDVLYPQLTAVELLGYLAVELGADESAIGRGDGDTDRTIRQIERCLQAHTEQQRHPVIIIDDSHLIDDPQVLQSLQLLLNYQQHPRIDFSLILIGERSLIAHVQRIEPLDERITIKSLLRPLSHEDTIDYVAHRLQVAGASQPMFDEKAFDALFEISGGVPRKINQLCDLSLLVGYADQLTVITESEIEAVSHELTAVVPD